MKTYELSNKTDSKTKYIVGSASLILGLLFNFAETAYFGWNQKPSCPNEFICDYISQIMIISGILIVIYVSVFGRNSDQS
jgi:hypothetical protein